MDSNVDDYITQLVGTFLMVFTVIFGSFFNCVSLKYFVKTIQANIFAEIFMAVCVTDLVTCVATVFVSLCYVMKRAPLMFENQIFLEVWGSIWLFTTRYSVFLVVLLSVTRTIRIACPFTVIRIR